MDFAWTWAGCLALLFLLLLYLDDKMTVGCKSFDQVQISVSKLAISSYLWTNGEKEVREITAWKVLQNFALRMKQVISYTYTH